MAGSKGSDPALAQTSVVLTAHLDHIGVRPAGEGDRINNGAYDNATGSAILLEVARALAGQAAGAEAIGGRGVRDGRGEGAARVGLLRAPPGEGGRPDDREREPRHAACSWPRATTSSRSGPRTRRSTPSCARPRRPGLTLSPDPMPEENIFVRSDQYSFVKQGVPAVYLMPGFTAKRSEGRTGSRCSGGSWRRTITSRATICRCRWICRRSRGSPAPTSPSSRAIADDPVAPTWKPGNFFGKMFGKGRLRDSTIERGLDEAARPRVGPYSFQAEVGFAALGVAVRGQLASRSSSDALD